MNFFKKIIEIIKKWISHTTTTTTTSGINPIPVQTPYILYGNVNTWMNLSDSEMETWMKAQNTAKLDGIIIEWFGYSEDAWEKKLDTLKSKFLVLLPLARKYGQRIYLSLVNWGDDNIKAQSDAWIQSVLDWFKANTKASDYVAFQMASEWSDEQGARWCSMAESTLYGYPLGWNKDSRPTTATSKYVAIDYHGINIGDIQNSDKRFFNNCDHSTTISQISDNGVTSEKFNATKAQTWATTVFSTKGASVGLYGYGHKKPDYATITALGKIRNDTTTTTTTSVSELENLSNASWQGAFKGPNAKATITSSNLNVSKGSPNISFTYGYHDWPYGDAYCDSVICAVWITNGIKCAAYLDYCPKKTTTYTWNCLSNMNGSDYDPKPKQGDKCGFFILSQGLNERSSVVESSIGWPL